MASSLLLSSDLSNEFVNHHCHHPSNEFPVEYGFGYAYDDETRHLFVAGGCEDGKRDDKLYEMELIVKDGSPSMCFRVVRTWDLPHGKGIYGCACVLFHKKVFIIGGEDGQCNYLKDVYSFDRETATWQKEASMNEERLHPSVVVTKRQGTLAMLVCGGASTTYLDSCEEYDDSTKQWTVLPCRLNQPRWQHVSICHGGSRVVVAGGYNSSSKQLATTEVIDLESSSSSNPQWNLGPHLEVKRNGAAACIVGQYMIIAGGYDDDNKRVRSSEVIALRDLVNDGTTAGQWRLQRGLEMKMARSRFGMVLVDNNLMVLSGNDSNKTCEMLDVSLLLLVEATTTTQSATTRRAEGDAFSIPETFHDAFLSFEDENKLPLHAAVKFADLESLNEALQEAAADDDDDISAIINQVDSQGRSALDLAALTGQPEMVQALTSQGGQHKFGSVPRMKRITRSRSQKQEEYLAYVDSLV